MTLDLKGVYDKIVWNWQAQHADYMNNLTQPHSRLPHQSIQPLFTEIISKIHPYALGKINEQLNKLAQAQTLPLCSHTFRVVMSLPCADELFEIRNQHGYIVLESINGHWHYNRADTPMPTPILDPIAVQPRRLPRGALTRRQNPATNQGNNLLELEIRSGDRRNDQRGGSQSTMPKRGTYPLL